MIGELTADLQPLPQQNAAQLGHKLFSGIAAGAKGAGLIPLKPRLVACGVNGLMAPGGIERWRPVEAFAQRQLDAIGAGGIKARSPPQLAGTGQAERTCSARAIGSIAGRPSWACSFGAGMRAAIKPAKASPSRSQALNTGTGR